MAYIDVNVPVIEKITLPSGNSYFIADREIRDVVDALSQAIAGGVTFIVGYDGTNTPDVSKIPNDIEVYHEGNEYTGQLSANDALPGAFYLVYSSTQTGGERDGSGDRIDHYDEYVPVGETGSKSWEKIGDTQVSFDNIVKDVTLTKQTDKVIGSDSTFKITQPTVALSTGATAGTGVISVTTGISSVTQPTVALSAETATATGRQQYVQSVSTTKLSATASGAAVSASGDNVTALTGLGTPTTDTFLKGVKVTTQPTVALTANTTTATGRIQYVQAQGSATTTKLGATVNLGTPTTQSAVKSVTPTTAKLATTTVTGVQSSTTTASKATAATSQTTAKGTGTKSTTNTDWLKGISVSNGVLTISAATMDTQTTTQQTFSDVTVPIKATSATTVASGSTTSNGSGASIVTGVSVGDSFDAVTGYASPTATIASGTTGDVTVATGIGAATTRYLSAAASGTAVGADGTADAVTGYASPTTGTVLGTASTFNVTQPIITLATGSTGTTVATGGTTKYMAATASGTAVTPTTTNVKATASGADTAWNSKDEVTVLTSATDINVSK